MKNKERLMYYIAVLGIFVLLVTVFLHNMLKTPSYNQQYIESKLPERLQQESETNEVIRVLIKSNGFKQLTHTKVQLYAAKGLKVTSGDIVQEYGSKQVFTIEPDNELFKNGSIKIEAIDEKGKITIKTLKRGYGMPSYRGFFELFSTAEGIVIVNELLMEEYLCAVVPSEMPASYEMEALKAQAICARSYAYNHTRSLSYPEYNAHVDDSTTYQVYGNSREQDRAIQAVNATAGKKLWYQGSVAKTFFYSTSGGHSTSIEAWGTKLTEKNQYLKGLKICNEEGIAYEKDLPWYRWTVQIPKDTLSKLIELNTGIQTGKVQKIEVTKRGVGDVALELVITGTKNKMIFEVYLVAMDIRL